MFPEIRLRHPSESVLSSLHAPKLSYLRDLIVRIALESGQRVVVFSQWRRFLELAPRSRFAPTSEPHALASS